MNRKLPIERANPRGRFDVLAYRVVEHLAEDQAPREWPALKETVAELCAKLQPRRRRRRRR